MFSIDINNFHRILFSNSQEFYEFKINNCVSARKIELFESLLYSVRTDTAANFCKDFFSPTLVNYAFRIEGIALKIFMAIVCAYIDVCTLPIRLITLIPRYFYNLQHTREKHPLYQYVLTNNPKFNGDSIDLKFQWEENKQKEDKTWEKDPIPKSCKERLFFIQVPQEAW